MISSLTSALRLFVLRILQYLRLFELRWKRLLARLSWSWKQVLLMDEERVQRPGKVPKCPAVITDSDADMLLFLMYALSRGAERVVVHMPSGPVVNRLEDLLGRAGFTIKERRVGTNFSFKCSASGSEILVDILADRHSYSQMLQDRGIGVETSTGQVVELLETPKIDMLIVIGKQTVGDFPPLALRACEIYFAESPLNKFQLDIIEARFARTEQRYGT